MYAAPAAARVMVSGHLAWFTALLPAVMVKVAVKAGKTVPRGPASHNSPPTRE